MIPATAVNINYPFHMCKCGSSFFIEFSINHYDPTYIKSEISHRTRPIAKLLPGLFMDHTSQEIAHILMNKARINLATLRADGKFVRCAL